MKGWTPCLIGLALLASRTAAQETTPPTLRVVGELLGGRADVVPGTLPLPRTL